MDFSSNPLGFAGLRLLLQLLDVTSGYMEAAVLEAGPQVVDNWTAYNSYTLRMEAGHNRVPGNSG